jgi:hypothetical protein
MLIFTFLRGQHDGFLSSPFFFFLTKDMGAKIEFYSRIKGLSKRKN